MKRFLLIIFFIIGLCGATSFIVVKCLKNQIITAMHSILEDKCTVSYQDLSLASFHFPLYFTFKLDKPNYLCNIKHIEYDFNIKLDQADISFNGLDNYLDINLVQDVHFETKGESFSCSNLDSIKFQFVKNIFSFVYNNNYIYKILYNNNNLHCGNNDQAYKLSFSTIIDNANHDTFTVRSLLNANLLDVVISADGSMHVVKGGIGSSLNIKNIIIKKADHDVQLQGDLLLAHNQPPFLRGKMTLFVNNYQYMADNLVKTLGANNQITYDQILNLAKIYATSFDDKRISITLEDRGDELYLGKFPILSLLASSLT